MCSGQAFPGQDDPFPGYEKHCQCANSAIITEPTPKAHPPATPTPTPVPPPPPPPSASARLDRNLYVWEPCAEYVPGAGAYTRPLFGST